MDMQKIKTAGIAVAAVVVGGAVGYYWSQSVHEPEIVEVVRTACGVPAASASFGVPLQTALQSGKKLPFGVGPFETADSGGLVRLVFDPAVDGRGREVRMIDGTLHLPTAFGRDSQTPERITITCRDGTIASVRYQRDRRSSTTFNVLREERTAMAPSQPVAVEDDPAPSTE